MIILLKDGLTIWVHDAKRYTLESGEFRLLGPDGKVLAVLVLSEVIGWFCDDVNVTTFGFAEKLDARQ